MTLRNKVGWTAGGTALVLIGISFGTSYRPAWPWFLQLCSDLYPNIVAGLLGVVAASLLLPRLFEESAMKRYVAAMKPIRKCLKHKIKAGNLKPEDAQDIMQAVVAGASSLHFGTTAPPHEGADCEDVACSTCDIICDIKDGACSKCHEPFQLWSVTQPSPDE